MYPSIEIFGHLIFVFWLTIVVCFFLFLWMLKKLSIRLGFDYNFIANSIFWYFISVFLFSRMFFILSLWRDSGNIDNFFQFFITSDYNFSLYWAIFGFFLVFFFNIRLFRREASKYIDGIIISFLFIAILWFIGAFFWWQVYGNLTSFWIEIQYNEDAFVPLHWKLFPLALIYSFWSFLLFSVLYILSMYIKVRGLLWYVWLGIFSCMILGLDFYSWKTDVFKAMFNINLSQISALVTIIFCFIGVFYINVLASAKRPSEIISQDE